MTGRVSGILSSLKRPVARKAVAFLKEEAPESLRQLAVNTSTGVEYRFWQSGSGHDENVSEPVALHALIEYVHLNPVRRGLVERPEDWPWSSARDWHNLPDALLRVDRTVPETIEVPWTMRRQY
jgi:putative transposase